MLSLTVKLEHKVYYYLFEMLLQLFVMLPRSEEVD